MAPLIDWTSEIKGFWQSRFDGLEDLLEKIEPMNEQLAAARSIVIERLMPRPPEKIWRTLTERI